MSTKSFDTTFRSLCYSSGRKEKILGFHRSSKLWPSFNSSENSNTYCKMRGGCVQKLFGSVLRESKFFAQIILFGQTLIFVYNTEPGFSECFRTFVVH